MELIIDNANLEDIKRLMDKFPYDGVTTNPTILKKEGTNPITQLKKIKEILPKDKQLHVQVISNTAKEIIKEAHFILKTLGDDTYIKIPVFEEGICAIKNLSDENINITATAIYTPMQGFVAAKAGAKYVAPYVNRLDNIGADGVQVSKDIHDMLTIHNLNTKVLAASFKNTQQVLDLCKYGIKSITAAPDILLQLVNHPITTIAIKDFTSDFYDLVGKDKTMMDC